MRVNTKPGWNTLEQSSPWLFTLAAAFLLVGAANSGLSFLTDGYTFNEWLGIVLELGRLAALLGAAGLSMQIVDRDARIGNIVRAVASLAAVGVTALIAMATLVVTGALVDPIGSLGLVAYVLSVSTFLAVGIGILRTDAYSPRIGVLLLVNVIALLVVFFGRLVVPLGLVATVIPAMQVLLYLGVGFTLRGLNVTTQRAVPATDTIP